MRGYVQFNKYTHTHTHTHTHVGKGRDLGGTRIKRRQERDGFVAAHADTLENGKEAGGKHKVPRERVFSFLCRV